MFTNGISKTAKELTTKGRKQVAEENFALPGRRYPIHDKSHARNALARVAQHGSPEEQAKVKAAVHKKFPNIGKDEGHEKEAAILPNWMTSASKMLKGKAAANTAAAGRIKANIAASKAARGASGFGQGLKSTTDTAAAIRQMPNLRAGRVEKGIAKSQGIRVTDPGSKYKKSMSVAKAQKTQAAAAQKAADTAQPAGFREHFAKHKKLYAAGAGGYLLGRAVSSGDQQ